MMLQSEYDNAGADTEERERQKVFEEYRLAPLGVAGSPLRPAARARGSDAAGSLEPQIKADAEVVPAQCSGPAGVDVSSGKAPKHTRATKGTSAVACGDGTNSASAKPKAKAKPKGRPPKNIMADAQLLFQSFAASDVNHTLWWGAECKTQYKKASELKGLFVARIQGAKGPDAAEVVAAYEPVHKKLCQICLLMEAHQKSGFDSVGFIDCYDCCLTSLRLPPAVELDMPSWLRWKRHAWHIKVTSDTDIWFRHIARSELSINGAADADAEQMQLMASRVLTLVRAPKFSEVVAGLKAFFVPDRSMDLSLACAEFYAAMVVSMHFDRYPIEQRIELLDGVCEYFEEEGNSSLVAAVRASPRGRDAVEAAKKHCTDCKIADRTLKAWSTQLSACRRSVELVVATASMSSVPMADVGAAAEAVSDTLRVYDETNQALLPEFRVPAHDDVLKEVSLTLLKQALCEFFRILTPIMADDLNMEKLRQWDSDNGDWRSKAMELTKPVVQNHAVWTSDEAAIFVLQVRACRAMCQFFARAAELGAPSAAPATEEESIRMVRCAREDFGASFEDHDFAALPAKVLASPLLAPTSPLMQTLARGANAAGVRYAEQILKAYSNVFPNLRREVVQQMPQATDLPQATRLAQFQIDSEVWAQSCQWAITSGDAGFGDAVKKAHLFHNVIRTAGASLATAFTVFKAGVKYEVRSCNEANCRVVGSFLNAAKDFLEAIESGARHACERSFSCDALADMFSWRAIAGSVEEVRKDVLARFSAPWTADLKTFETIVSHSITPFEY